MPDYAELLAAANALPPEERERLAREIKRPTLMQLGGLTARPPAPQAVAWLKAERGHAVLATDTGPAESDIPAGADAIAGMWSDMTAEGGAQP